MPKAVTNQLRYSSWLSFPSPLSSAISMRERTNGA